MTTSQLNPQDRYDVQMTHVLTIDKMNVPHGRLQFWPLGITGCNVLCRQGPLDPP